MAISGLIMAAFVLVHMIGNLKVYGGAEGFNDYAMWLRDLFSPLLPYEGLLWLLRVVLLISLVAHVYCAAVLYSRARRARGRHRAPFEWRSFIARTMPVTGLVLLGFIVFHILDLTTGQAGADSFQAPADGTAFAYQNLVASMQRPVSGIVYLVTMLLLAAHLWHGIWTAANDLGATGRRTRQVALVVAGVVAIAVLLGNASIPIAVLAGWLT